MPKIGNLSKVGIEGKILTSSLNLQNDHRTRLGNNEGPGNLQSLRSHRAAVIPALAGITHLHRCWSSVNWHEIQSLGWGPMRALPGTTYLTLFRRGEEGTFRQSHLVTVTSSEDK